MAKPVFPCRKCGWNEGYGNQDGNNIWFCGKCHMMLQVHTTQLEQKSAQAGVLIAMWIGGTIFLYVVIAMMFGS